MLIGAGMYLAWFGVHYFKRDRKDAGLGTGILYPTDPVKAILQGKGLPPAGKASPTSDEQAVLDAAKAQGTAITGGGSVAATSTPGVSSAGCPVGDGRLEYQHGEAARLRLRVGSADIRLGVPAIGLAGGERLEPACFQRARRLQPRLRDSAGQPGNQDGVSAGPNWKDDPTTQIRWGLAYIKATYGSPSRVPGWTANGPAAGYVGY